MHIQKVLFIGFGSIAKKHAKALRSLFPKIQLDALRSSTNASSIEGITNLFDGDTVPYSTYDFVIISNPSYLHAATILEISKQTKAFFIEKPAFLTIEEGNKVVDAIGIKLNYVACNLRFLDCLKQIKTLLEQGSIHPSQVLFNAWSYLPDWRPSQDYRDSYSASESQGGGVLYDLIHEPDYIYWLFGEPIESFIFEGKYSDLEIDAADSAIINLNYPTYIVSGSLSFASRITKRNLQIIAAEGLFEVDLLQNTITHNGICIYKSAQRIIDTYQKQMEHFVECLQKDVMPLNDAAQALTVSRFMQFK